jgi:small-conductance mechanosensitive channel
MNNIKNECINFLREFDEYVLPGLKVYILAVVIVIALLVLPESKISAFVAIMSAVGVALLRSVK